MYLLLWLKLLHIHRHGDFQLPYKNMFTYMVEYTLLKSPENNNKKSYICSSPRWLLIIAGDVKFHDSFNFEFKKKNCIPLLFERQVETYVCQDISKSTATAKTPGWEKDNRGFNIQPFKSG